MPTFKDLKNQQQHRSAQPQPPQLRYQQPAPPPPCGTCPAHPLEPLRVFCADCNISVCTLCAVDVSACKTHRTKTYSSILAAVTQRLADVRSRPELQQQQVMHLFITIFSYSRLVRCALLALLEKKQNSSSLLQSTLM